MALTVVVTAGLLLWRWLPGPAPSTSSLPTTAARAATAPSRRPDPARPRVPKLRANAPLAEDTPPEAMSEGLAQDLEMFDGVQLKAELESIALSHPGVRILDSACSGLPCRAEATATDPAQLSAFQLAVSHRFQGHVSARVHGAQRLTLWVGTRERNSAMR